VKKYIAKFLADLSKKISQKIILRKFTSNEKILSNVSWLL